MGTRRTHGLKFKQCTVGASDQLGASIAYVAKLNGLDPEAYLRFVIERIADYRISDLDDLLPWNVAAQISKTTKLTAATDSEQIGKTVIIGRLPATQIHTYSGHLNKSAILATE